MSSFYGHLLDNYIETYRTPVLSFDPKLAYSASSMTLKHLTKAEQFLPASCLQFVAYFINTIKITAHQVHWVKKIITEGITIDTIPTSILAICLHPSQTNNKSALTE